MGLMSKNGNAEEYINQMSKIYFKDRITELEARDEDDLNFTFIQQKLLSEYQRRCLFRIILTIRNHHRRSTV